MKNILIKILQRTLKMLARLTIKRYKPTIIGITGSVGKTSAKRAVSAILAENKTVRFSPGNFNNELGLPLTVLGPWKKIPGKSFWIKVIIKSSLRLIFKVKYPEVLVLEYGADKPGDIKYLLSIAKPDISIITAIGEVPVHIEFYDSQKDVVKEKAQLVNILDRKNIAILNYDDPAVRDLSSAIKAQVVTYGFSPEADFSIEGLRYSKKDEIVNGIKFQVKRKDKHLDIAVKGVAGKTHAYAVSAGVVCALVLGYDPDTIQKGVSNYKAEWGRMKILKGGSGAVILSDAYNASPLSMKAALETLGDIPGERKIAILGDMKELGKHSTQAHKEVGEVAAISADILIVIGKESRQMIEGAQRGGMKRENIHHFNSVNEARFKVKKMAQKGDVILVKASRAMEFEKLISMLR